ncbi:hypothetical protein D1872_233350 [compost metagenome]
MAFFLVNDRACIRIDQNRRQRMVRQGNPLVRRMRPSVVGRYGGRQERNGQQQRQQTDKQPFFQRTSPFE